MFIQTQQTPNPNSLKFLTEKKVSLVGPIEFKDKSETNIGLIKNILSINGVTGIFLSDDYLSVNKDTNIEWEDLKHIIIRIDLNKHIHIYILHTKNNKINKEHILIIIIIPIRIRKHFKIIKSIIIISINIIRLIVN